ncbi:plasmid stabilization protein [Amycolatopsis sp. H6(2020)]|nr:plasmid stabilization protein [Amycolatopsis sp. H6(2020)]
MSRPGTGLLLDSGILAQLRGSAPDRAVVAFLRRRAHRVLYVSVLSLGELAARFPGPETDRWLDELAERFRGHLLPVDDAVARAWAARPLPAGPAGLRSVADDEEPGEAPGETAGPEDGVHGLLAATARVHGLSVVSAQAAAYRAWGVEALDPAED